MLQMVKEMKFFCTFMSHNCCYNVVFNVDFFWKFLETVYIFISKFCYFVNLVNIQTKLSPEVETLSIQQAKYWYSIMWNLLINFVKIKYEDFYRTTKNDTFRCPIPRNVSAAALKPHNLSFFHQSSTAFINYPSEWHMPYFFITSQFARNSPISFHNLGVRK